MRRPVQALLVNVRERGPGQMVGIGDVSDSLLNIATGGTYKDVLDQLDTLTLLLKVSIAASLVAGIAGVISIFREQKR